MSYVRVLDGLEMSAEWVVGIVVPIYKEKGDIRNCSCHRAVKHLENQVMVVEMVL